MDALTHAIEAFTSKMANPLSDGLARQAIKLIAENLPELLAGIVGLAFLLTLGLTGLELFVIHAFCQYCLYSAVIVIVMFILAISIIFKSRK